MIIDNLKKIVIKILIKFDFSEKLRERYLFVTHHDYLLRSHEYFNSFSDEYDNFKISRNKKTFNKLHKKFKKNWVRSDKIDESWWILFFKNSINNFDNEVDYKNLIETTKKIKAEILSVYEWLELYNFLMFLKLTEIGLLFRNLARQRALSIKIKKNNPLNRYKFGALIEIEKYDEALTIIDKLPKQGFNTKQKKIIEWLILILKKKNISENEILNDESHFSCKNDISNKSIALITSKKMPS